MLERCLPAILLSVCLAASPVAFAAASLDPASVAAALSSVQADAESPADIIRDNPLIHELAGERGAVLLDEPDEPDYVSKDPEPITPPPTHALRIVLDWYVNPYHAALIVARERGLFDRLGLDVTLSPPADPSVPPKLVAAGRAELALVSEPSLHRLVDQGLSLIRVGTLIPLPLSGVLVRDDAGIDSVADLEGKTIGYAVEGPARVYLDALFAHQPFGLDAVTLQPVDFGLGQALAGGKVDAIVGPLRPLERDGLAEQGVATHELEIEDGTLPLYDALTVVANRDTLSRHRRDIAHFMNAVEEAMVWIVRHPQAAWTLISQAEPALDTPENARAWPTLLPYFALRPGLLQVERYRRFEHYLYRRGLVGQVTPLASLAVDVTAPETPSP
ncbi:MULTISPECIES: ABC transporter substrate-binding protein [Modicisalibacter]|uniref:ABC transporter substrate-binding protein n=1 Tax=Modicisalibacter TaxID=574347 RepID=UPI001396B36B|nr:MULTISPECIES: ABC transporter substrate-binding protein [Halomonadaceae]MBZ9556704.1 ABC transporter substrate-binding protein [Modicisalibacter sp. R2A 31.J]MBZ9574827.1 ABC transporter substrate-binding protein [Modicisalibacter sp. MOD 31.J]